MNPPATSDAEHFDTIIILKSSVLPGAMMDWADNEAHMWCQADRYYNGKQMFGVV